jgi:hypothetical protein
MNNEIQRIIALPSFDSDYSFGKPKAYLTAHELARLTILRSRLGETRQEREAEAVSCQTCDTLSRL